jgi:hypothetical protein
MSYILIENKGEIHVDALTLMGGSTKRDDSSKLGRFGSGNKYAIASLLRNNIDFKIFSGEREIIITTKKHDYRGTELDKIFIDGKETSLTVQMGPDWEYLWMAIREWVQNSVDEGEMNIVSNINNIEGREGKTRFYVKINDEIQDVIDSWDNYFTFDRIDCIEDTKAGKIFPNLNQDDTLILFSRGIKCTNYKGLKSLYNYDGNIEMNESRIIKHDWQGKEMISNCLSLATDKNVIFNVLKNAYNEKTYENVVWESWLTIKTLSSTWKEVIGDKKIVVGEMGGWFQEEQSKFDCFVVGEKLAKKIKKQFPDVVVYGLLNNGEEQVLKTEVILDKRKEFLLNECHRFFNESSYNVEYPIKVVRFKNSEQLGLAENNIIYLSEKCFDMGKRELAITIIEENEHLKTGYKDETRAFQQHFINLFISQMEERVAFFL